ncbi:MAG: SGNH/GDSL hydrolase family protein [Chloroflexia bacterium]
MKMERRTHFGLTLLGLLLAATATLPTAPTHAAPPTAPTTALGRIDAQTRDRLRRIWQAGQQMGRRAHVLAKVGDSITASGSFLSDIGDGNVALSTHKELAPIIAYYRAIRVDHAGGIAHNSLNRRSLTARAGWTTADLLAPPSGASAPSPLKQEYDAINPSVAVIMIGTNDLDRISVETFRTNLADVVDRTLEAGIIPILSTVPDRMDSPAAAAETAGFNGAIRDLGALEHLPVIDYWAGLQSLPSHGLAADLVHPSIYPSTHPRSGSVTFTSRALTYGWNLRNFLTLEMLAKFKRIVIDEGTPDP